MKPLAIKPPTTDARDPSGITSPPFRVRKNNGGNIPYRNLLEPAPDALVIVNQSGTIVVVNGQAERLFGYRQGEMIGRPAEILVPEHGRDQHRSRLSRF